MSVIFVPAQKEEKKDDRHASGHVCLSCGRELHGMLSRLGSLRCDPCRETSARLDSTLVERWRAAGSPF